MLSALNNQGKHVTLASFTQEEIDRLRKVTHFCPICNEKVVIRSGPKVMPHFAHLPQSNCSYEKVKGESEYHRSGKWLLYQWLNHEQLHPTLEKYYEDIKQRPDIVCTRNKTNIAVEFQCATIRQQEVLNRHTGLLQASLYPLWIIGYNQYKQLSFYTFRMKAFFEGCLVKPSKQRPVSLIFFCPQQKQFHLLHDMIYVSNQRFFALKKMIPLRYANFLQLFPHSYFTNSLLYTLWADAKRTFRMNPNRPFGNELNWRRWLYAKGLHLEQLPSIVYLPSRQQYKMIVPLWQWQSYLVINVLIDLDVGKVIPINRCIREIDPYIKKMYVKDAKQIIYEYFNQLASVKIIKRVANDKWVKLNSISFPTYIEEALHDDRRMIRQLKKDQNIIGLKNRN